VMSATYASMLNCPEYTSSSLLSEAGESVDGKGVLVDLSSVAGGALKASPETVDPQPISKQDEVMATVMVTSRTRFMAASPVMSS